ncbi:MAG: translocation protein TolB [Cyclobacteriaceae bacterium]|nr:translocation protein TolB [Cyclobacteriaceae bacterium]UYN87309.1 MAG: translocation protein TolB [Cyclobacteriaceae bacterium]
MRSVRVVSLLVLFVFIAAAGVEAQQAREVFGKNRQQFRTFDWQYLSGENFDVYYYDNRRAIANEALQFLELEFDRMTDLIGYPPYFKTKIFLYNSLSDLRQSNVGLNKTYYNIGGETDFVKPYVEVAHMGTAQELKSELLFKISELLLNEMMYGGNLKDIFQSALLMNLPEWFVNGAALYVAHGWTAEMDDYIRQVIKTRNVKKISRFNGPEAAYIGQSVWNFIVERYGKSSISNILNYTRVTRNEEKSILITLGVSYNQLVNEWYQYYNQMSETVNKSYVRPADSLKFSRNHNVTTEFTTIKISPDGRYLAYAENDRGRYVVKVQELASRKETVVLSGGTRVIGQRVDYRLPIISWSDANTLGVVGVKRGEYTFWLYDLTTKTKLPRELDRFSNVRSFTFSSNGRLVVLSGDFEGQSDLFLLSTRRDRVRRLTNDAYDDLDPSFIPGTNRVVFSSNRVSDTLSTGEKKSLGDLTNNYNLFVFDLDTTNLVVSRITNTLSKDYAPKALNDNVFFYLSDQRGIINLFKYDRSTGIYTQVSNFSSSIREYDFNFDQSTIALTLRNGMKDDIYLSKDYNLNRSVFTPATRRRELQQVKVLQERRKQEEERKMSIKDLINARLKEAQGKTDSTSVKNDSIPTSIPQLKSDTARITVRNDSVPTKKPTVINTDNYVFEDEVVRQAQPSETFLNRYMRAREKSRIMGPFPYESKFSADNIVTSFVIDPLRGLGFSLETQMNDMLENYRFYGGLMSSIDLRNADFFAEFQYLPSFIDFSARFDRKAIRWEPYRDANIYHYSLQKIEVGAAIPITDRLRLAVKPFGALTRSVNQGLSSFPINPPSAIPVNHYYAGVRSELVYDNSVTSGLNIIEGTRGKLIFNHYQGIDQSENSFSQVSLDIRHYQKIYRGIVLAVRGFGGSFFGRSPKQYLLGGMDNWAFNRISNRGRDSEGNENVVGTRSENQDILFAEFATNLRGFRYATLFGNNVVLMNAEFRVPLARALSSSPISSNFFRNMQFIAFYDIGTSWSGPPPFNSGTSVRIDRIKNGPFEIDIKNFLNPWLYSYGAGMRTVMFGYYMKFDLAWPVENYQAGKPQFIFTLGFDF